TPDSPAPVHGHLALTQAKVEIVRTSAAEVRAAIEHPALREMIVRELVAAFADASTRQRPLVEARCLSVPNTASAVQALRAQSAKDNPVRGHPACRPPRRAAGRHPPPGGAG